LFPIIPFFYLIIFYYFFLPFLYFSFSEEFFSFLFPFTYYFPSPSSFLHFSYTFHCNRPFSSFFYLLFKFLNSFLCPSPHPPFFYFLFDPAFSIPILVSILRTFRGSLQFLSFPSSLISSLHTPSPSILEYNHIPFFQSFPYNLLPIPHTSLITIAFLLLFLSHAPPASRSASMCIPNI